MDLSQYFPALVAEDELYTYPEWTVKLRDALSAKEALCTMAAGVANTSEQEPAKTHRMGRIVNVYGRFNRTSATISLCTLAEGYLPAQNVFTTGLLNGGAVMVQLNAAGLLSTPNTSATGDVMVNMTYLVPAAPLPA